MTDTEPKNLMQVLLEERDRCKELLKAYEEIGPPGRYGAMMLRQLLKSTDDVISSGDVVLMIQIYKELKGCQ